MYIPPEKRQQIIDDLDCFEHRFYFFCIKIEFQKILNFLDTTYDDKDLPRFVIKTWIKFYDQSEKITTLTKKSELKHQC